VDKLYKFDSRPISSTLANIGSCNTSKVLTAFATFIAIVVNKLGGLGDLALD
jgi:hypothetical protein